MGCRVHEADLGVGNLDENKIPVLFAGCCQKQHCGHERNAEYLFHKSSFKCVLSSAGCVIDRRLLPGVVEVVPAYVADP